MKKIIICVLMVVLTVAAMGFAAGEANQQNSANVEFLKSYGWEVEKKPIEKLNFTLPEKQDDVYKNYNILQMQAGLDLSPYMGKSGVRYTYRVINYPRKVDDEVRANVLVIDGVPVAGDVCTVSLDGFMHSLAVEDLKL